MTDFFTTHVLTAFLVTVLASLATVIGGALVLFAKQPSPRLLSFGLAFAGGAMVYVSLTEILNKSIAAFSEGYGEKFGFAYGSLSFLTGILLVIMIDRLVPNPHEALDQAQVEQHNHNRKALYRTGLLTLFAITAHNFPEGLATFFATLGSASVGMPLAVAIAIHNIPEGIAIALPVYMATQNKRLALLASFISGMAEPVGALLGYAILAPFMSPLVYGLVFGLIGGVMVFLALDELLPAAKRYAKGHETVYGLVTGMSVLSLSLVMFQFF
ncbi:zinc transporter ZupT [Acinetobacter qingfengensis]|uniref:Zinc transporter ZupT n=1 Tax=Acinetobacter qingfengensis TaxID=1262585 RepID=A0A1E7QWN8_9GAMM|nr:zinc transporter ZupT [Acinetobacter qingfengensis]KAA8731338.1 zinc transporter ZupT [Acinetobacter qingfengensis]OEY91519.1 zinc transporter ZupT [Acinetobacter qingfengensis]